KFAFPTVLAFWIAYTLTRLNRFSISTFTWAVLFSPTLKIFINDASTFFCEGERRAVMVRGAVPNVFAGARLKPAALIHVAVRWSAEDNRSSYSPGVVRACPERLGR